MDDIDRRIIQIYLDILANETNFNHLFVELVKKENIITPHLRRKFKQLQENGVTNNSLNRELYEAIQTRGKNAFHVLVQCLKTLHPHLAELLLPRNEPEERKLPSVFEEEDILNQNEPHCTEYEGICTMKGKHPNQSDVIKAVQKLCHLIKARLALEEVSLTQANFHVGIKIEGKFQEEDIQNIENLYTNLSRLKIIIINIISEELDNAGERPPNEIKGSLDNSPAVFIVNIHIHKGDHSPSVINIIKEVVSHNPDYEIRDIFRVVMEKLAKWGCRLNTESRNFPKFYF